MTIRLVDNTRVTVAAKKFPDVIFPKPGTEEEVIL